MQRLAFAGFLILLLPATALAQIDPYALSLEELTNIPVTVASRRALSQRETPGIVTVITGDEIRYSGARNLIDVLRQVPGIDFRMMLNNGIGLGMRGQIGSDGRVLMLVDGVDVNEHRYGSAVFGQGFPVEQIARIEIVRGSALALYGGSAELGVINIITRNADELDGVTAGAGFGSTGSAGISSQHASLMAGKGGDARVKWTAMAHVGSGMRSDRTYQDLTGASFDMANANRVYLGSLNLGLQAAAFSARFLHDEARFDDRDGPGFFVRAADSHNWFYSDSLLMKYRHQVNPGLDLAPSVLYQAQDPRKTVNASGALVNETKLTRMQARLPLDWDAGTDLHLSAGLEYLDEHYQSIVRNASLGLGPLPFERTAVTSAYGEALWHSPWGNLTLSARMDDHTQAGWLRSERFGYTRIFGDWHAKLMGSFAKRAPTLEDYAYALSHGATVKPETSRTWEIETGYRISPDAQLTLNLFDVTTLDTLLLGNTQTAHSRGLEAGYKTIRDWGDADVTYSYYSAAGSEVNYVQVIDYATNQVADSSMNLAFPSHKLTASLHYKLAPGLSLNPSLVYLGPRWGYVAPIANQMTYDGTLKHFAATPLLNVALYWEDAYTRGLNLTLGLYNAFDREVDYIQPFNAGHAPLPAMSREAALQAQFKF